MWILIYMKVFGRWNIIIMMSDGVIESNESIGNKERWMKNIIENIDGLNQVL